MVFLLLLLSSFLICFNFTALIKNYFGQRILDIPNERSSHIVATPRGGGLSFIIAFAITGLVYAILDDHFPRLVTGQISRSDFLYLWLALTPLAIIGLIDDYKTLSARVRYLVQLVVAVLITVHFGLIPLPGVSSLNTPSLILDAAFTVIGITALINFYNFMDGLDGLVASLTALQLILISFYFAQPFYLLLATAIVGFLWWNWSPAKIFMGDVGSTVLGAIIAIALLSNHNHLIQVWSALTVTFPLIGDAIYTIIRRLLRKENIFQAHRSHLYQRLQQSGWSHEQVTICYLALTLVFTTVITWFDVWAIGVNFCLIVIFIWITELYLARQETSLR
jgi:UDP-N-acetylmuramyl pentapeptide phosphotransferase/UDP-N-acetylglucosamine-1-phosphate transferase